MRAQRQLARRKLLTHLASVMRALATAHRLPSLDAWSQSLTSAPLPPGSTPESRSLHAAIRDGASRCLTTSGGWVQCGEQAPSRVRDPGGPSVSKISYRAAHAS